MTKRRLRFAKCSALCGIAYMLSQFFAVPDPVMCFTVGMAFPLLLLAVLPEEVLEKLEKRKPWKRHGE